MSRGRTLASTKLVSGSSFGAARAAAFAMTTATVVCSSADRGEADPSCSARANSAIVKHASPIAKIRGARCTSGTLYLALMRRRQASGVATRPGFGSTIVGVTAQPTAKPSAPATEAWRCRRSDGFRKKPSGPEYVRSGAICGFQSAPTEAGGAATEAGGAAPADAAVAADSKINVGSSLIYAWRAARDQDPCDAGRDISSLNYSRLSKPPITTDHSHSNSIAVMI